MAKILLIIGAVILGFWLIGMVLGLLFGLLKWAFIIGVIALVGYGVMRLMGSGSARSES